MLVWSHLIFLPVRARKQQRFPTISYKGVEVNLGKTITEALQASLMAGSTLGFLARDELNCTSCSHTKSFGLGGEGDPVICSKFLHVVQVSTRCQAP